MTIDGGGDTNTSFMPAKCTSEYAIKKKIVATSTNTSGGKVSFSIGMNVATLSDSLKTSTMKFALTTAEDSCTNGLIANGNFKSATVGSDIWIVKNDYDNIIKSGNDYTKAYYLYIWLDEEETQNLSGSISVNMKGTSSNNPSLKTEVVSDKVNTLYDYIESNADTTTQIDFNKSSEQDNTNGIYMTYDSYYAKPVYYYRGNVDNRIIFANFCWRIVRTTGTGGVKLIYDGVPTNGQCNNTGEASTIGNSEFNSSFDGAKYAGYTYGSSFDDKAKLNASTIKTVVDTWYNNNMTNYTSQLDDGMFYSDGSYTKVKEGCVNYAEDSTDENLSCSADDQGNVYYTREYELETVKRVLNAKPNISSSCGNNCSYTDRVGLITVDEAILAGAPSGESIYGGNNRSYYLYLGDDEYGDGYYFWTMSPLLAQDVYKKKHVTGVGEVEDYVGGSADVYAVTGYVCSWGASQVMSSIGVRPVVSLKPGIALAGGSGTATDPFVILS